MPASQLLVERTRDGSPTLYSQLFDAHYHSTHGAVRESEHVFIKEGLDHYLDLHGPTKVNILEYGLGTGLNAALTFIKTKSSNINIYYEAMEAYPVPQNIYGTLDYFEGHDSKSYQMIHDASWNTEVDLTEHFTLRKNEIRFEDFIVDRSFDIIYFDAFAPNCQPHLWTEEILKVAYDSITDAGILVTFCAQGAFKRALRSVGFEVAGIPGPPGKREMTRATK